MDSIGVRPWFMRAQSQIQRTLSDPAAFERLAGILARETFVSRRAAGRRVRAEFGFQDRRGQWQVATCLQALGVLADHSELIALPAAGESVPGGRQPAQLADGVGLVAKIPEQREDVRELVPVAESAQRHIWNTLIAHEHRQGLTTFAGAQMRYLVGCTASSEQYWTDRPIHSDRSRRSKSTRRLNSLRMRRPGLPTLRSADSETETYSSRARTSPATPTLPPSTSQRKARVCLTPRRPILV